MKTRNTHFNQSGVDVSVSYSSETDVEVTPEEIKAYIDRVAEFKSEGRLPREATLVGLNLKVEGEDVDISYEYGMMNFERIRRITGYLVGSLDRFNNAKRSEVEDRVKHTVQDDLEDVYVDSAPKAKSKSASMERD